MAEEVIEIGVKPVGGAEAQRLAAQMQSLQRELDDLNGAFSRGAVTGERYAQEKARLTAEANKATAALEREAMAVRELYQQASMASAAGQKFAGSLRAGDLAAGAATRGAGRLGNRLMVIGQTLDDLQYVPEMGLRPIINNLMQISPAAGVAAIALQTLVKHGAEIKSFGASLADYWGLDETTSKTTALGEAWKGVGSAIKEGANFLAGLGDGLDHMMGGKAKREAASVAAFLAEGTDGDKERGRSVAKTIDNYGRKQAVSEMVRKRSEIDPSLRDGAEGSEGRVREESAALVALVERAKKGDRDAISTLEQRMAGTRLGAVAEANSPEAQEQAKAFRKATDEQQQFEQKRIEAQNRAAREANDKAEKESESRAKDQAKAMQGRFDERALAGSVMSEKEVRDALVASGSSSAEAEAQAPKVASDLAATFDQRVKDNALKQGGGMTWEESRADLAQAEQKKKADEEAKRAQQIGADFKRADPNVAKDLERQVLGKSLGLAGSMSHAETVSALAEAMKAKGLGEDDAARRGAAEQMTKDAEAGVAAKVEEGVIAGQDKRPFRTEVFGGGDFNRAVLTASTQGDDPGKQQLDVSKQMLAKLVENVAAINQLDMRARWPGKR